MATRTSSFGVSGREGHDASAYYSRALVEVHEDLESMPEDFPDNLKDQIFNVDCLTGMKDIPDNSVSLMITSPPYHVGKEYDGDQPFSEYIEWLYNVWSEVYRVLQPGGRAAINVAGLGRKPYIGLQHLVHGQMLDIGYLPRGEIVWIKGRGASGSCAWGTFGSAGNPVLRDLHEYILLFSKSRYKKGFDAPTNIAKGDFMQNTLSVWEMVPASAKRLGHPAPFPVELPRRLIELLSYAGEIVLDPFMGSGTTAVAAAATGRHFIGYETHKEYIDIATERLGEVE